jgi:peptidoglycan/LPS O-acetylase OafA/YrhL
VNGYVSDCARDCPGFVAEILSMPSVVYVGRISDGLYLFHNFMPHLMRFILETEGIEVTIFDVLSPGVRFGLLGTVTLLLATLSW